MINRPSPCTVEFALGAIDRLNARRIGHASFDAWINFAVRNWKEWISAQS